MAKQQAKAKPAKRVVKKGDIVFYFLKEEESRLNQGERVLPAIVVSVQDETVRLTVFGDSTENPWKKGVAQRSDISETGVFDFTDKLPE